MALSQQAQKNLNLLQANFPVYSYNCLQIKTKEAQVIPFVLNKAQKKLDEAVERQMKERGYVRILILKARREGVSTYVAGRFFHRIAFNPNISGIIAAHDLDSSTNLFEMHRLFYNRLPEVMQPTQQVSNRKEMIFDTQDGKGLNSRLLIDTASNMALGRSYTLQLFHGSEVAFWRNAKEVMLGVANALEDVPGSMSFLESTANGVGGWFWEEYYRAKRGESDYEVVFLPWWIFPEYRRAVPVGFEVTNEEKILIQQYSLDLEQIVWRRWAIANKAGGDLQKFKQEYPASDDEAFIVSGNPVFDQEAIKECGKHVRLPMWVGNLEENEVSSEKAPRIITTPKGYVKIWVMPKAHHNYVMGGDVAFGVKGTGTYSSANVIDRNTGQVVACWHGHIPPDLYGQQLKLLARLYNNAFTGAEVNGEGLTVNRYLRDNYGSIYVRTTYDKTTDKEIEKLGWQTDKTTRPIMISDLGKALREGEITIYDAELLSELMTFVRGEDGKPQAQEGAYDDRVMSLAIAVQMSMFVTEGKKPKVPTLADMIHADIRSEQEKSRAVDADEEEYQEVL